MFLRLDDASVASTTSTYRIFRQRLTNSAYVACHHTSSTDTVYEENETKNNYCIIVGFAC